MKVCDIEFLPCGSQSPVSVSGTGCPSDAMYGHEPALYTAECCSQCAQDCDDRSSQ